MKYVEKACGNLWGKSMILEDVLGNTSWIEKGSRHYKRPTSARFHCSQSSDDPMKARYAKQIRIWN